jgi:Rod binding domain-containing protein
MNITPIVPGATNPSASELTPTERARAAHLHGSALRNASPAEQRAAVATQFEAILVRQLLGKTMNSMLGHEGAAAGVYGDLLTDTIAQQLTAGRGLGLSGMIEKQLTPRSAAKPTTTSAT